MVRHPALAIQWPSSIPIIYLTKNTEPNPNPVYVHITQPCYEYRRIGDGGRARIRSMHTLILLKMNCKFEDAKEVNGAWL